MHLCLTGGLQYSAERRQQLGKGICGIAPTALSRGGSYTSWPGSLRAESRLSSQSIRLRGPSLHSRASRRASRPALTAMAALPDDPVAPSGDLRTEWLTYDDAGVTLHAYVAYPPAGGARCPGVLVGHTAVGVHEEFIQRRTEAIARLGYVALALDMFGTGEYVGDPEVRKGLMTYLNSDRGNLRRRVLAAHRRLAALPQVDGSKIGAVGYCLGGRVLLDLARAGADVAGVVSLHGVLDRPELPDHPEVKAKVLAIHGDCDPFSSREGIDAFQQEMRDKQVDWQLHVYGGCYHGFTRPDKTSEADLKAGFQYNAAADRRSWNSLTTFLAEVLQ